MEVEGNLIHYIDEGSGPILFLLHPGVGWSFMYSDMIKELRSRFRCVALDLPGYGLSPAVPGYRHTLTGDSRLIERFIQTLGLSDVTLLIFGDTDGTIKMGWLARLERIFPRHRSIIMKGSHHFPHVYDPAADAAAIRSFWDEEVAP